MGCMQWHVGINSLLDVVTLALQPPAVMISRSIFAKIRYKFTYITSRIRVQRQLVQKLSLEIVTLANKSQSIWTEYIVPGRMISIF